MSTEPFQTEDGVFVAAVEAMFCSSFGVVFIMRFARDDIGCWVVGALPDLGVRGSEGQSRVDACSSVAVEKDEKSRYMKKT